MSENEVIIGNVTTIIMFVFSTLGGGAIIESLGGTSQVAIVVGAIVGLAFSFVNAYYPNFFKFLNNNRRTIKELADSIPQEECQCKSLEEIEEIEDDDEEIDSEC